MNKQYNHYVALSRATEQDFDKYPKKSAAWRQELSWLRSIYEPVGNS